MRQYTYIFFFLMNDCWDLHECFLCPCRHLYNYCRNTECRVFCIFVDSKCGKRIPQLASGIAIMRHATLMSHKSGWFSWWSLRPSVPVFSSLPASPNHFFKNMNLVKSMLVLSVSIVHSPCKVIKSKNFHHIETSGIVSFH